MAYKVSLAGMRKGKGPFSRLTGSEVGIRITYLLPGELVVMLRKDGSRSAEFTVEGSYPWPTHEGSYAFEKISDAGATSTIVEVQLS